MSQIKEKIMQGDRVSVSAELKRAAVVYAGHRFLEENTGYIDHPARRGDLTGDGYIAIPMKHWDIGFVLKSLKNMRVLRGGLSMSTALEDIPPYSKEVDNLLKKTGPDNQPYDVYYDRDGDCLKILPSAINDGDLMHGLSGHVSPSVSIYDRDRPEFAARLAERASEALLACSNSVMRGVLATRFNDLNALKPPSPHSDGNPADMMAYVEKADRVVHGARDTLNQSGVLDLISPKTLETALTTMAVKPWMVQKLTA
jgi:hypothetical protein